MSADSVPVGSKSNRHQSQQDRSMPDTQEMAILSEFNGLKVNKPFESGKNFLTIARVEREDGQEDKASGVSDKIETMMIQAQQISARMNTVARVYKLIAESDTHYIYQLYTLVDSDNF